MSVETSPCPFCGAVSNKIIKRLIETARDLHDEFAIQCNNCGAVGPFDMTIVYAVKMWNMRRNSLLLEIVKSWNAYQSTMDAPSAENKAHWTSFLESMGAAQHCLQPTADHAPASDSSEDNQLP